MMGEIQGGINHVKVDNWPLFFLQRLHHLYRKEAHCDLTLLFPSINSVKTIKVHRVVLLACTDYFDSLDVKEDSQHGKVLVISSEIQPDVMVPIISFMYTGKLEFPVNLQPKLYEAARKLKMTILAKLLEVQPGKGGKTYFKKEVEPPEITIVENPPRSSGPSSPKVIEEIPRTTVKSVSAAQQKPVVQVSNPPVASTTAITSVISTVKPKVAKKPLSSPISAIAKSKTFENSLPPTLPGRKLPIWTRKIPSSPLVENTQNVKDYIETPPRPTRFEWDEDLSDPTSIKPVEEATKVLSHDQPVKISQPIILENTALDTKEEEESPKRSFSDGSSSESPPYKKFRSDLQDMKEYGKQQQLRNEIICSEENLDDMMDTDDLYGSCDDDDIDDPDDTSSFNSFNANSSTPKPILKTMSKTDPQMSSKRVRFSLEGKENNQQENTSSGGDFTALKEPETDSLSQKIVVPVSQIQDGKQHVKIVSEVLKKYPNLAKKDNIKLRVVSKNPGIPVTVHRAAEGEAGSRASSPLVSYIFLTNKGSGDLIKPKTPEVILKEKLFDVENTTGPWFCRVCNISGPLQFDSYYNYRKHLVQVHELRIDARICEYCGLRNSKRNLLLYHMYTKHGIDPPPNISFPKCSQCDYIALSDTLLAKHRSTHDPLELTCYTCNVVFKTYSAIQMHMKSMWHKSKASQGSASDYPCPFCSVKFANGGELKEHIETCHHSQMVAAESKKQIYRCPYCEGIFDDGDKLGKHIVSKHWGNKAQVSNQGAKAVTNAEQSGQQLNVSAVVEEGSSEVEAVEMQPSSESESLNNVASGIATSLGLENDQAVVFYEERSAEDQDLGRETTVIDEDECKEFIVINPIEVGTEGGSNEEMETDEVETIKIVNENAGSRLLSAETNQSSCTDHDYSESQTENGTRQEVISVQEIDGSPSSVIQKLLPDEGLVFANESDVVFESSCVALPQRVILTSGNIVLPEGSSPDQGVILSQVLPQTQIILTSPGILQQSGSIIEKGSTLVFASTEDGDSMEAIEGTVEFTDQTPEDSKDEELGKQEEGETVIVLASSEPGSENAEVVEVKKDEEEVETKPVEVSEEVVAKKDEETNEGNKSVIKTIGETFKRKENVYEGKSSESKESVIVLVDDDATSKPPSETMEVIELKEGKKEKEETVENTSNEKKEEDGLVMKSRETKVIEGKRKEETKPTERKKEEGTKVTENKKKEEDTRVAEEKKKEEETKISEKMKEEETKITETLKEEEIIVIDENEEEETKETEKKKEEETKAAEKKKEEETKAAEKKKEEEGRRSQEKRKDEERKAASHRVETSRIVEDWDESNDSQPKIESRRDGPSRPEFF